MSQKHVIISDIIYCPDNLLTTGHWWNNTDKGQIEVPGEKPVTMLICAP